MTYKDLEKKMPELTALLFTHPKQQDARASEIWIKFKKSGFYIFLDFEQPFPKDIQVQKLVGAGNALDCSENKKDKLNQYVAKSEVIDILDESLNFGGNISDTVEQTKNLFSGFKTPYLHL